MNLPATVTRTHCLCGTAACASAAPRVGRMLIGLDLTLMASPNSA
jgi:hypothetical protein